VCRSKPVTDDTPHVGELIASFLIPRASGLMED